MKNVNDPAIVAGAAAAAAASQTGTGSGGNAPQAEASAHDGDEEGEEEEETELSAETIIFVVLLCLFLALLIVAFCIWFSSRYQEAKLKRELSEALPFYNVSEDYDDFDDGDLFDSRSRGVVKPVIHSQGGAYDQPGTAQSKKHKGARGKHGRPDFSDVGESDGEATGFFGKFFGGGKKKKGKVGFVFDETKIPAEVMQRLYQRAKLKARPQDSRSDLSGAGDITLSMSDTSAGSYMDGSKVNLNDKLRKLEFERFTDTVNKRNKRLRSRNLARDYKLKISHGKTSIGSPFNDEGSSSDSDTGDSKVIRKSRSFPDLLSSPHIQSDIEQRRSDSNSGLSKCLAPSARPSFSDALLHMGRERQRGSHHIRQGAKQRFPDRHHRRAKGEHKSRGSRRGFSSKTTRDSWPEGEPVAPSEGHLHILVNPEKKQTIPVGSVVSTVTTQASSSIQLEPMPVEKADGHLQADSMSTLESGKTKSTEEESSDLDLTKRARKMRKWLKRRDGSPSASSQPLSSRLSPLVSASSSTWLTSLLSETDLKLGNIDREMDQVLSQVCSHSHSTETEWSSESLGFIGGDTSSSTTDFTEPVRIKLPKNSQIDKKSHNVHMDADEANREASIQETKSQPPRTKSSSDSYTREKESTGSTISETFTEQIESKAEESERSEIKITSSSTRTSPSQDPATEQSESKEGGSEGSEVKTATSTTSSDARSERYQDTSQDRANPESSENPRESTIYHEKEKERSGSENQSTQSKTGNRGIVSSGSQHTGPNDGGNQDVLEQSDIATKTESKLEELSHRHSVPNTSDSAHIKSSSLMSSEAATKTSESTMAKSSSEEKTQEKDTIFTDLEQSSHSKSDRNVVTLYPADVKKFREKKSQTLNKEGVKEPGRKKSGKILNRKEKNLHLAVHKNRHESKLIEGLDAGVQTVVRAFSDMPRVNISKDQPRETTDNSTGSGENTLQSTTSKSSNKVEKQGRSSNEEMAKSESAQKTIEDLTDIWELPTSESPRPPSPPSYEDKKSQVLKMFDPKYFTFPMYQPVSRGNSSHLHSQPAMMPSQIPDQAPGISTNSELSTTDLLNNSLSGQSWPSSLPQSSMLAKTQSPGGLGVNGTKKQTKQGVRASPGIHRGMGGAVPSWQFMTPGLGRRCTHRALPVTVEGAAVSGYENFPYKASDILFQDSPACSGNTGTGKQNMAVPERPNDETGQKNKDNALKGSSAQSHTFVADQAMNVAQGLGSQLSASVQRSEDSPRKVLSMPAQKASRNFGQLAPDKSKSFPAPADFKSGAVKLGESDSEKLSTLDLLWQSEKSKELSKSRADSNLEIGSPGMSETANLKQHILKDNHILVHTKDQGAPTPSLKESSSTVQSRGKQFASTSTSNPVLQNSNLSFVVSMLPSKAKLTCPSSDFKTYPVTYKTERTDTFCNAKSEKSQQQERPKNKFLETLNKELDTFVDTAGWISSKSPSQIHIDWDKCSDERKKRQQEKLKKVLISENSYHSQTPQQQQPVQNRTDLVDTTGRAEINLGREEVDLLSNHVLFPRQQNYSNFRQSTQSSTNIQGRHIDAKGCVENHSLQQQLTSGQSSQHMHRDSTQGKDSKPQPVSYHSNCVLPGTQRFRVGSRTATQASPTRHGAKLPRGASPGATESLYSTGKEDVNSLDSWASAQTKESPRLQNPHPVSSTEISGGTHYFSRKLPPSVVVLSPNEVKLLTAADKLCGVNRSKPAREKNDPSKYAVSLAAYKTSGKPFTSFPQAQHAYISARDTIMCAEQLTKFRTGRRPDTQFHTPGIHLIPSDIELSASQTSCCSSSGADFMSVPSLGEASQQESWTSVRGQSDEAESFAMSCAVRDKEELDDREWGTDVESRRAGSNHSPSLGTRYRSEEGSRQGADISKTSNSGASTRFMSDHGTENLSGKSPGYISGQDSLNSPVHRMEKRCDYLAEFSTDFGSDKGTNYKSDLGTEYGSDFGLDIKFEKSLDQVFEKGFDPQDFSLSVDILEAVSHPHRPLALSIEEGEESVDDYDKEEVDPGNLDSGVIPQDKTENVVNEPALTTESDQKCIDHTKSESDGEDVLRVLSYLSSQHSSLSASSINCLISRRESEAGKSSAEAGASLANTKSVSEQNLVGQLAESQISKSENLVQTPDCGAKYCDNNLSEQHRAGKHCSSNLSVFTRPPSPVEATSVTSEWITYPTVQRVREGVEMETEDGMLAPSHADKPVVVENIAPAAPPDGRLEQGAAYSSESSVRVSSLSLPVSVFSRVPNPSPNKEAEPASAVVNTSSTNEAQPTLITASTNDKDHLVDPQNINVIETPRQSNSVYALFKPPELADEATQPVADLRLETMKSKSFTEFCNRLDEIITAPQEEDGHLITRFSSQAAPQQLVFNQSEENREENSSHQLEQKKQALTRSSERSNSVAQTILKPLNQKLDGNPLQLQEQQSSLVPVSCIEDSIQQAKVTHRDSFQSKQENSIKVNLTDVQPQPELSCPEPNNCVSEDLAVECSQPINLTEIQANESLAVVNNLQNNMSIKPTQQGLSNTTLPMSDTSQMLSHDPGQNMIDQGPHETNLPENKFEAIRETDKECFKKCLTSPDAFSEITKGSINAFEETVHTNDESKSTSKQSGSDADVGIEQQEEEDNLIDLESLPDSQKEQAACQSKLTAGNIQQNPHSDPQLSEKGMVKKIFRGPAESTCERFENQQASKQKSVINDDQPTASIEPGFIPEQQNLDFNVSRDPGIGTANIIGTKQMKSSMWKSPQRQAKTVRFEQTVGKDPTAVSISRPIVPHNVYKTKQTKEMAGQDFSNFSRVSESSSSLELDSTDKTGLFGSSFESPVSSVDQKFLGSSLSCVDSTGAVSPGNLDSSFDFSLASMVTLDPVNKDDIDKTSDSSGPGHDRLRLVYYRKFKDDPGRSPKTMTKGNVIENNCKDLNDPMEISYGRSAFAVVKSSKPSHVSKLSSSSHADGENSSGNTESNGVEHSKARRKKAPKQILLKTNTSNSHNAEPARERNAGSSSNTQPASTHFESDVNSSLDYPYSGNFCSLRSETSSSYDADFQVASCPNLDTKSSKQIFPDQIRTNRSYPELAAVPQNKFDPKLNVVKIQSGRHVTAESERSSPRSEETNPCGLYDNDYGSTSSCTGTSNMSEHICSSSTESSSPGLDFRSGDQRFYGSRGRSIGEGQHCCGSVINRDVISCQSAFNRDNRHISALCKDSFLSRQAHHATHANDRQRHYKDMDMASSKCRDSETYFSSDVQTSKKPFLPFSGESVGSVINSSLEVLYSASQSHQAMDKELAGFRHCRKIENSNIDSPRKSRGFSLGESEDKKQFRHDDHNPDASYPKSVELQHQQRQFSSGGHNPVDSYQRVDLPWSSYHDEPALGQKCSDRSKQVVAPPNSLNPDANLKPLVYKSYIPQGFNSHALYNQPKPIEVKNINNTMVVGKSGSERSSQSHGENESRLKLHSHHRSRSLSKK
ncbi:hypothetical protein ElyMa_003318600 [Elysia marginata]|uniref:Uncharacterized protein n=1 Tax=Elysia marginata TaxID=1093978 RepID=A0AAV4JCT7_9GAST|nr:hypothetical protein ElyMa_003318600 [Elysia marginata]